MKNNKHFTGELEQGRSFFALVLSTFGTEVSSPPLCCTPRDGAAAPGRPAIFGIFFVFAKGLRARRAGRVAPQRGGAGCRAAAQSAAPGG